MRRLKQIVIIVAVIIFSICLYTFLGGNKVFQGQFANDYISWYFLAKGFFCSFALYLLVLILENMSLKK